MPRKALAVAVELGCLNVLKILVNHFPADANVRVSDGRSLIHHAAIRGHFNVTELLASLPGIDVNAADYYGCTPMHDAARYGHIYIVKFLASCRSQWPSRCCEVFDITAPY